MEPNHTNAKLEKLFSESQIEQRVKELASEISRDYADNELHIVGVMKGAFIFLSDLIRHLTIPCFVEFIRASSYGNEKVSSGIVKIEHALSLRNKHVLLIEDIVDTGLTLNRIIDDLKGQQPASLKICALLDKPESRKVPAKVDYMGFTISNDFVVGYGIDYAEKHRQLPYIAKLKD